MISKEKREYIFARDGYGCVQCKSQQWITIDHFTPKSAGGTDKKDNLQTLCFKCNNAKGDTIPTSDQYKAFQEYLEMKSKSVIVKHTTFDWANYSASVESRANQMRTNK